jgi:hypothetical protein
LLLCYRLLVSLTCPAHPPGHHLYWPGSRHTASWTAAHPVNELTQVNTVRLAPFRQLFGINWVGQDTQGLINQLRQSGLAQNVNHVLLGELHAITQLSLLCAAFAYTISHRA